MQRRITISFALIMLFLSSVLVAHAAGSKNDPVKNSIKYRQSAYQMIKWHFGPLAGMVKGKIAFDAEAFKANAKAVATLSYFPIHGFKHKSLSANSDAKAKIWQDWDDFKSKMTNFKNASQALAKASDSGDMAVIKPAFGKVGKTCKSCHKAYRKKKKK